MIEKKMYCEICGEEFFSEYYTGGYIDHVVNFVGNRRGIGSNIRESVREICFDGNDIREPYDIMIRLNCFMKWENVPEGMKKDVEKKSLEIIQKIKDAKAVAEKAVEGKSPLELKYIREAAHYMTGNVYAELSGCGSE